MRASKGVERLLDPCTNSATETNQRPSLPQRRQLPASGAPVAASAAAAPPTAPLAAAGASQQAPPPAGALALAADSPGHAERVSACRRLFTRVQGSPRLFRHEVYAYIAEHERGAWETIGRKTQREIALVCMRGAYPSKEIVGAWATAMAEALDGFSFGERVKGDVPNRGYSTTELAFNAV